MFISMYLLVTICGYVVGLCCTCNMNINLNESITTVNLLDYSLQSQCIWRLEADRNASIVVKGVFVRLTGSLDRVVALDGSSVNGSVIKQCDFGCTLKDFLMVSSGNTMLLIIELDENPGKRIVEVQAWAQKNGGRYYNDGNINLKNGAKGAKSYFQLHSTDQNQQVQVLLQESTSFLPGSIAIYDGYSETDDILVTFRNDANFNVPITSSKQDLLVVATDQKYLFGKFLSVQPGFHKVSSEQSSDFILDRTNFISECDWLINPSLYAGNIMFEIRSVDLCDNETLEIYEGLSTYGQRLAIVAKSTGAINFLKFTTAAGKGMSVFLNTDAGCTTDIPFSGSYWIVPDCTADLQTSGTITSPQYPSQYHLNAMCTWLTPTKNITTSFYITFNNLNLSIGHNITVTNAVTVVMNYTGSELPSDLLIQVKNDTTTSIDFYSYSENAGTGIEIPGQGFNLSYRVLDCGESLTSDRGIIDSNTSIPADAEECVWIVTVPPKSGKSVNIISFTIDIIGKANWQNLELRDGGSVRSPLLHQGDKPLAKSMSFMTRYNKLWIHYRRNQNGSSGDLADEQFSFYLSFSTYSCDQNHLCQNGICLHPEWRCNGVNDCGDNTDELGCADSNTGVKVWIVVVIGVVCFLLGVVIAIAANMTYNRWRHRNYSKLESTNDPALR